MADDLLSLSSDFTDSTEADWHAAVAKALKGAGPEKLSRLTDDDLLLRPLYRESDWPSATDPLGSPGIAPFLRGPEGQRNVFLPWDIRQSFRHPDPAETKAEILYDLERGVSSIALIIDPTGANGIQLNDGADYETVLADIDASIATIALDHGGDPGLRSAAHLINWARSANTLSEAKLALNIDPLGALARSGHIEGGLDRTFRTVAEIFQTVSHEAGHTSILRSDSRPVHEAGGSDAQELAVLIASAIETLRRLQSNGIALETAARHFVFALAVDANFGIGIAKLRAARRLWARCLEVLGAEPHPMLIQAVTSARMLTRYDPWVNILRGTGACFAAAVGGADIITVRPFTHAFGTPEALGRRIARNTQIIAMEESQLGRVADPSGGAWFMEHHGNDLAELAWEKFQSIEAQGGYSAALLSGTLQADIGATRAARAKAIATRKVPITGLSSFPLLEEIKAPASQAVAIKPDAEVSPSALLEMLSDPGSVGDDDPGPEADPLWPIQLAAPFERLRDHAEAKFERTGKRPSIFLATLGPLAEHTARADFARNLFAAGGIDAKSPPVPPKSTDELVAAWRASGCALAVLCGSDDRYQDAADAAAKSLKQAGVQRLYLAGRHQGPDIDSHIYIGVNVIHTLELAHAELGLAS
ncbi:MAG: methylmalonyl-CoA mutase family protein [Pseudomonadota bacterium]